jgi:hypothetical protein
MYRHERGQSIIICRYLCFVVATICAGAAHVKKNALRRMEKTCQKMAFHLQKPSRRFDNRTILFGCSRLRLVSCLFHRQTTNPRNIAWTHNWRRNLQAARRDVKYSCDRLQMHDLGHISGMRTGYRLPGIGAWSDEPCFAGCEAFQFGKGCTHFFSSPSRFFVA